MSTTKKRSSLISIKNKTPFYKQRHIGVIVDAPDPDNFAAVLMALFLFGKKVKFVIVTGRPAHSDSMADISKYEQWYSERVLRLNTRRLKGFLRRHGYGHVLVFEGDKKVPPSSLVRHSVHIPEHVLDIYGDDEYYEVRDEDRTFDQAVEYIKVLEGLVDLIVGGPLTEVAALLKIDTIKSKLGTMVCQLGLFGFGEGITTIAGGGLTFNAAADREAVVQVVNEFPGDLIMIPTDITKRHDVGFDTTGELLDLGLSGELVQLTGIFHRYLPKGSRIFPHDVHAACVMHQVHGSSPVWNQDWQNMYKWVEVEGTSVGERGQISTDFGVVVTDRPKRFVVTDVDAAAFVRQYGIGCAQHN